MTPISDRLLDQLGDEMREIAREIRIEGGMSAEDDADKLRSIGLAALLDSLAATRPLLSRFAFILRQHSSRHSALATITGAGA